MWGGGGAGELEFGVSVGAEGDGAEQGGDAGEFGGRG